MSAPEERAPSDSAPKDFGPENFGPNDGLSIPGRFWRAIRDHGPRTAVRRIIRSAQTHWLEWRLGIDTRGSIHGRLLGSDDSSFGYQPIPYASVNAALDRLPGFGSDSVFVDLGCGKGRALIAAALRPIRRAVGVEISAELCEVSRRNIARAQRRLRCGEVEVVQVDARHYQPPSNASVFFFFNPFDAVIMRIVLGRLRQSWEMAPRDVWLIYSRPRDRHNCLAECGDWLDVFLENLPQRAEWEDLSIYRSKPWENRKN